MLLIELCFYLFLCTYLLGAFCSTVLRFPFFLTYAFWGLPVALVLSVFVIGVQMLWIVHKSYRTWEENLTPLQKNLSPLDRLYQMEKEE